MTEDLLAYDDQGTGSPILFIHGMTFSRRTWDPIVERLRDRFRCVSVDLPGHGESTGSGADPMAVCARINATCVSAGIGRPVVVGHSAGSLTATGYASVYPARGVVNVDQTMFVAPFAGFVQQLAPALRGPSFDSAFAPFRDGIGLDRLPEPERSRTAATQRIDQSLVLDYWAGPLSTPPSALQTQVNALLDAIRVPYLWLAGDNIADADRELLLAHLPGAEIEEWPGGGHMLHLAEPDRFATRLAEFTERHAADS